MKKNILSPVSRLLWPCFDPYHLQKAHCLPGVHAVANRPIFQKISASGMIIQCVVRTNPPKSACFFWRVRSDIQRFIRRLRSDTAAVALPIYSRIFLLSIFRSPDFFQIEGETKIALSALLHSFSDHTFQTENSETGQQKINHRVWSRQHPYDKDIIQKKRYIYSTRSYLLGGKKFFMKYCTQSHL